MVDCKIFHNWQIKDERNRDIGGDGDRDMTADVDGTLSILWKKNCK